MRNIKYSDVHDKIHKQVNDQIGNQARSISLRITGKAHIILGVKLDAHVVTNVHIQVCRLVRSHVYSQITKSI